MLAQILPHFLSLQSWQVCVFSSFFITDGEMLLQKLRSGVKVAYLVSALDQGLSDPKVHVFQNLIRRHLTSLRKLTWASVKRVGQFRSWPMGELILNLGFFPLYSAAFHLTQSKSIKNKYLSSSEQSLTLVHKKLKELGFMQRSEPSHHGEIYIFGLASKLAMVPGIRWPKSRVISGHHSTVAGTTSCLDGILLP